MKKIKCANNNARPKRAAGAKRGRRHVRKSLCADWLTTTCTICAIKQKRCRRKTILPYREFSWAWQISLIWVSRDPWQAHALKWKRTSQIWFLSLRLSCVPLHSRSIWVVLAIQRNSFKAFSNWKSSKLWYLWALLCLPHMSCDKSRSTKDVSGRKNKQKGRENKNNKNCEKVKQYLRKVTSWLCISPVESKVETQHFCPSQTDKICALTWLLSRQFVSFQKEFLKENVIQPSHC